MTTFRTPPVYQVIVAQLLATALCAAAASLSGLGAALAVAVAAGGLISALPNGYFALQAFRYRGAGNADKVVRSFTKGEFGKIGMTLVLFALAFTLLPSGHEAALLAGFIAVQLVGVIASAWLYSGSPPAPTGSATDGSVAR